MPTNSDRLAQAQRLYYRSFINMARSNEAWHLYALPDGMALAPAGAYMVILVANVHGIDCQTLSNRLRDRLSQGTPHVWATAASSNF